MAFDSFESIESIEIRSVSLKSSAKKEGESKAEKTEVAQGSSIKLDARIASLFLKVKNREGKQRLIDNVCRRLESIVGVKSRLTGKDKGAEL